MTHWNYRVIRFAGNPADQMEFPGCHDDYYAIHEVVYNDDGTPRGYGEFAAHVFWTEEGEGGNVLDMMREALEKPVLTEEDFK